MTPTEQNQCECLHHRYHIVHADELRFEYFLHTEVE